MRMAVSGMGWKTWKFGSWEIGSNARMAPLGTGHNNDNDNVKASVYDNNSTGKANVNLSTQCTIY